MKIGIPQGMFFYKYSLLWNIFFAQLGIEIIKSANTNQKILNDGICACIGEACMPVKAYIGHVADISKTSDMLFIPRYTSISKREYICPMVGGLPNMVRSSIDNLPPILDTEINMRKNRNGGAKAAIETGQKLGFSKKISLRAYNEALNEYTKQRIDRIGKPLTAEKTDNDKIKILLMGHAYTVYDKFLNLNLVQKIQNLGADIITTDYFDSRNLRENAKCLDKPLFWNYGTKALGCTYEVINSQAIDGIIFLTCFGCGADSFVGYMVERRVRQCKIPFMTLLLDEHTGEAGMNTRIEAFMDTINWRKKV